MSQRQVVRTALAHRQREGGGFVVRRPLPSFGVQDADPFLLLDEMGPIDYEPGEAVGAPDHPHRGFETVTYVLAGSMEHEDSAGHRGAIGPGDVQWMTAGRGVVHAEMPSRALQREGGRVHGFQLWVNLPAKDKMIEPRYQEIGHARLPEAQTADGRARVKVIAGEALGVRAAIETRTPISYLHWTLAPGADVETRLPTDHAAYVYVFAGEVQVGERAIADGQLAVLGDGETVRLSTRADGPPSQALLLSGRPLREPVARYGPFVMNSEREILEAIDDLRAGRLGAIRR